MQRILLKSKIHRAEVTGAELHYVGSITLPRWMLDKADILPHEQVDILNVNNGERFTTYTIVGDDDSSVTINGPAARLVQAGDIIIICSYGVFDEQEAKNHQPTVIQMSEGNKIA